MAQGLGILAPLQPFSRSEKVAMGVISAPWSPEEVTSSLFPSAGSFPCAAGQLGHSRVNHLCRPASPTMGWSGRPLLPRVPWVVLLLGQGSPSMAKALMPAEGSPA